jgi:hypothetical protein
MSRCLSGACVGVLVLAAAGCTLDAFLSPQFVDWGPSITVSGSVDEVAAKLRDGLSEGGFLNCKRIGSDYRISSTWTSGRVYCLHLRPAKTGGSKTLVRIQWDRGGDDELWQHILKILATADSTDDAKP